MEKKDIPFLLSSSGCAHLNAAFRCLQSYSNNVPSSNQRISEIKCKNRREMLTWRLLSSLCFFVNVYRQATNIWLKWEKGNVKWQRAITDNGNKLLRRIAYEEWFVFVSILLLFFPVLFLFFFVFNQGTLPSKKNF